MKVSKCCNSTVRIHKYRKKLAMCYVCNKCKNPCDIIKVNKITNKQKKLLRGNLNEF